MEKLKEVYNYWLGKHYKAMNFFESPNITWETKEKWYGKYMQITATLGEILDLIGVYSEDEVLNGFVIKKYNKEAV